MNYATDREIYILSINDTPEAYVWNGYTNQWNVYFSFILREEGSEVLCYPYLIYLACPTW